MRSVPIIISGLLLGAFGTLGATLVGLSHIGTAERIAANEREALLRQIRVLVPAEQVDNDMLTDVIEISAPQSLGAPTTKVYRGWQNGQPAAVVLSPVVTQGYSGAINLIVAIRADGSLAGVRVLSHRETPGLGDKIEEQRDDWILGFAGRSLTNPTESAWKVKIDGGVFDQFTGATITPRSVVRGVKAALDFFADKDTQLFDAPTPSPDREANNG